MNKKGFLKAKLITKKYAKTFYFASRFLPIAKRYAAYSVYAICRASDDSVDESNKSNDAYNLNRIKEKIVSVYSDLPLSDDLILAFRETVNKYRIPKDYFEELIEGMNMDLNKNRYESFEELYQYCYRVAGVIGLIMLKIFGYTGVEAEKYAVNLGVAMQLTNILRDIKEDFSKNRIYLPKQEMNRFHTSEKHISSEKIDDNFIDLLKFQIERSRRCYNDSIAGIKMINNLNSRFLVCSMKDMYAGILTSIEKNRYDVFSKRAHVKTLGKIGIVLKILLKGQYL